ncbi:MAG: hypothetical protein ACHQLA_04805 [Ignavibacteriales bacterium]
MKQLIIISVILFAVISACTSLTLQPANFAWPLESALPVDDDGNVLEKRYSLEFNTKAMFLEEFKDSLAFMNRKIRLIRDNQGFYFITASSFKNVYVFRTDEGKMMLDTKIFISEFGLQSPAFNQRDPYIELVDGKNKMNLTNKGVEGGTE